MLLAVYTRSTRTMAMREDRANSEAYMTLAGAQMEGYGTLRARILLRAAGQNSRPGR